MSTLSPARLAANRANALKSTGPRTQAGKLRSSQNALSHGLTSTHSPLLPNEDPAPFNQFRESMLQDLNPQSPQELELAERIVSLHWRLRRCPAIEAELLTLQTQELHRRHDIDQEDLYPRRRTPFVTPSPTRLLALQFNTKDDKSNPLSRLQRYESTLDRTLRRCQADYRSLQLSRQIEPTEEDSQIEPTPSPAPPPPLTPSPGTPGEGWGEGSAPHPLDSKGLPSPSELLSQNEPTTPPPCEDYAPLR